MINENILIKGNNYLTLKCLEKINYGDVLKKEILNFENDKWRLIGLPFYTKEDKNKFEKSFEEKLNIKKEIKKFKF